VGWAYVRQASEKVRTLIKYTHKGWYNWFFQRFSMQNNRENFEYINGTLQFSVKNMKFRPLGNTEHSYTVKNSSWKFRNIFMKARTLSSIFLIFFFKLLIPEYSIYFGSKLQQTFLQCIIYQFSVFFGLFRFFFYCFGSIETPKHAVSILNRNNRNKCLVSDSVETSFGSIFGCFESKLVS
jgi:hypothetical protein